MIRGECRDPRYPRKSAANVVIRGIRENPRRNGMIRGIRENPRRNVVIRGIRENPRRLS
jgi:hypothetical protein